MLCSGIPCVPGHIRIKLPLAIKNSVAVVSTATVVTDMLIMLRAVRQGLGDEANSGIS